MSILSTEYVGHIYQDNWMFRKLNLGIRPYDRIALIGKNGVGKSTLLKILAGVEIPKEGKVVRESGTTVGYLAQNPEFPTNTTVGDFLFQARLREFELVKEYNTLLADKNADPDRVLKLAQELTELEAWEGEYQITRVIHQLGIFDLTKKTSNLSGGEKRRLALAKLLISDPDIFILDEPTNHLDVETTEWLENLIVTKNKTTIFVSHDRYFLDKICTSIQELTPSGYYTYNGNYNTFLEEKQIRIDLQLSLEEKQKNRYQKELEWMRRQPQARGTKSKARQDRFHDLKNQLSNKESSNPLKINFTSNRQGGKIIEIDSISKKLGNKTLFRDFSYVFKKGDRIGLAGKNGSGKSTFLNILSGALSPDNGEVIVGETTQIGYYRQTGINLAGSKRVIECITDIAEHITMGDGTVLSASQVLTQFSFPPAKHHDVISKLSGGERRRLQLLLVLFRKPNFLILDEPSNDLDLDTLHVLEQFLQSFPGVLILVSHDRYLLDTLTDQLFIFDSNEHINIYNGNYSEYKNTIQKSTATKRIVKSRPKQKKPNAGRSYKQEQEFKRLEEEISALETLIVEKTNLLHETLDHQELSIIGKEIESLNINLDEKSTRWLELADMNVPRGTIK